jgi:hypothetical protein
MYLIKLIVLHRFMVPKLMAKALKTILFLCERVLCECPCMHASTHVPIIWAAYEAIYLFYLLYGNKSVSCYFVKGNLILTAK